MLIKVKMVTSRVFALLEGFDEGSYESVICGTGESQLFSDYPVI